MNFRAMIDALCRTPMQHRTAIELFARDGTMATAEWAGAFSSVVGVDINKAYLDKFVQNVPNATALCMDSVAGLRNGELCTRLQGATFDLVSADSPQGFYGSQDAMYCEHFGFISLLPKLSRAGGFLHFNVNLFPYKPSNQNAAKDDYGMTAEKFADWMLLRRFIYSGKEVLSVEQAVSYYIKLFDSVGCAITSAAWYLRKSAMPNHPDHILYLLLQRA